MNPHDPAVSEYAEDTSLTRQVRAQAASRCTWVSVLVNSVLTLAQVLGGLVTQSQALLADGLHSLSDLLSDFIVLAAARQSRKAADTDHPYGHQRFETAAALLLGLLLLGVGAAMLWSIVDKFQSGGSTAGGPVNILALWIALGTLLCKEVLFRYLMAVARKLKSGMLMANAWHARSDAASSLVVALGIAGNLLGYGFLDPVAALIVGLMVLRMGWRFAWDALADLMDRAADDEEVAAIRRTLLDTPGVLGAHEIRTRKMGDMLLVDAHLEVDALQSVEQGHQIAVEARERVLRRHRVLSLLTHVDPKDRPDMDNASPAGPL